MAGVSAVATSRKRGVAGIGRVIIWPGGSIWVGRHIGQVPEHAHHAIQISLAIEGRFRVQARTWPASCETAGMVVMPDQAHRMDGCDTTIASLFVEPNSIAGAALRRRFDGLDVALLSDQEAVAAASCLGIEYQAGAPDSRLAQFAQGAICRIAGDPLAAPRSDPRVTAALDWMRRNLATPMRLQDVARVVHLSSGRFRHLFVAQTGTSFRAWLLWARAEYAIAAATKGSSWTAAAQEAGFSDAAHFTRTCRRVFGIAPTMLVFDKPGDEP
ncbi:MAG: AraC family transcriptional regulator [Pseudoxanthomonas sp.]